MTASNVISLERRLRKLESTLPDPFDLRDMTDAEVVDILCQEGPLSQDDENFVAWCLTGETSPSFDLADYSARYLR